MIKAFPEIERYYETKGDEDFNPSIRLFGRRFHEDQTVAELLVEFMLVAASDKRVGDQTISSECALPEFELLRSWPKGEPLKYAPKAHLNLKLFAFLGSSKLETRHETHRQHYKELVDCLCSQEKLYVDGQIKRNEVINSLENLFLGFQSVGGNRTWSAQAFLPVARSLVSAETIWNRTDANKTDVDNWGSIIDRFLYFFSFSRHRFLARGGELLYLQICNALRQQPGVFREWAQKEGASLTSRETDTEQLHHDLTEALHSVLDSNQETVGKLAEFIDTGIEEKTAEKTDKSNSGEPRYASCGWCPEESWKEGTLFAVEILRLCQAVIDPIERLELMEIACAMQVLRSLCAQSARYAQGFADKAEGTGPLGYVWAISEPSGSHDVVKQISRRNVNAVQRLIHDAIRRPEFTCGLELMDEKGREKTYKDADGRYGHKLFLKLAKNIGLIVPKTGAGARFVMNDKILRFLVLALIRPGQKMTYDTFKKQLFIHYGIAVDDESISRSCEWSGTSKLTTLGGGVDTWLTDMLDASGVLARLSDSCSLVSNPFGEEEETQ